MPSLDQLLSQLEEAKLQFGPDNGDITEQLLIDLAKQDFPDAESLIRFHEALLFVRSHPQSPGAYQASQTVLRKFGEYVDRIRASGSDMTPFDYIEYSGIARTVISGTFSYDIVRFLQRRHRHRIEVNWNQPANPERFGATLPRFVPLLYEDSLVEANIPYHKWLDTAASRGSRVAWLIRQFEALDVSPRKRAELYDSLGLRVLWSLSDTAASRSRNTRQVKKVFFHSSPLIRRNEVSLDREFESPPIALKKLSRAQGESMQDMLRDTTTVRYRELYGITHGDPESVVRADIGRGVEMYIWGLPPERRLPLRAYHAGFTLKNGVPINYIEGISICERMEIGFNTFYTFREGESAWVYAQVLRLLHQIVGVRCISIDPYQIGFHNDEAIDSGAFWFYRKLGFRPTSPDLAKLMSSEEKKIARNPGYRTPARVLKRLSEGNVVYEAPGSKIGDWDKFAIRNIGLAVQRRMAREYDGSASAIRAASASQVASAIGINQPAVESKNRELFEDLSMVLAMIPDLSKWSDSEKMGVAKIIVAKTGRDESRYARLLQTHARLRSAIIQLGSGS